MGVPAYYRWLSNKYPKIIRDVVEESPDVVDGAEMPFDVGAPNPNGIEFDNLYLDMNGIIHPCFHPEDRAPPTTEAEVFGNIFDYIDRLVRIIRPRRLIYMAIDGVAPRAKMNQQRSRRFRAAKDSAEREREFARLRDEFENRGVRVPPKGEKALGELADSNVITPGTPFMHRLSLALQYYIHQRLNYGLGWGKIKVLLSDANSPGEGEHKIMAFIRSQRNRPGFDPNTKHCLYGLDADLIMLALASHEGHFTILREVVFVQSAAGKNNNNATPAELARQHMEAQLEKQRAAEKGEAAVAGGVTQKPYQLVLIWVLREYLALEMRIDNCPFPYDMERVIDDYVFLCFFVGNDFLPHMPTLSIREGAIDLLINVYRRTLPRLGGYLTKGKKVHLGRVEKFVEVVSANEEAIFAKRMHRQRSQLRRRQEDEARKKLQAAAERNASAVNASVGALQPLGHVPNLGVGSASRSAPLPVADNRGAAASLRAALGKRPVAEAAAKAVELDAVDPGLGAAADPTDEPPVKKSKADDNDLGAFWSGLGGSASKASGEPDTEGFVAAKEEAEKVEKAEKAENAEKAEKAENAEKADRSEGSTKGPAATAEEVKQFQTELSQRMEEKNEVSAAQQMDDRVRLGEAGWRERYYAEKLGARDPAVLAATVEHVARSFVEGLMWVMGYYYEGTQSWNWYFPYHYAPFASDLVHLRTLMAKGGLPLEEDDEGYCQLCFDKGKPFRPFDQLLAVFPAASSHALPKPYARLMADPDSPLAEFYPEDFVIDMDGCRFAWQGVALLPFIDEVRLLKEADRLIDDLSPEEKRRNSTLSELLFVGGRHPMRTSMLALESSGEASAPINTAQSEHFAGFMMRPDGEVCPKRIAPFVSGGDGTPSALTRTIDDNDVACVAYKLPPSDREHECRLPRGCQPIRTLSEEDTPHEAPLWHEQGGRRGGPPPMQMGYQPMLPSFAGFVQGGGGLPPGVMPPLATMPPPQVAASMFMQQQMAGGYQAMAMPPPQWAGGAMPGYGHPQAPPGGGYGYPTPPGWASLAAPQAPPRAPPSHPGLTDMAALLGPGRAAPSPGVGPPNRFAPLVRPSGAPPGAPPARRPGAP